MPYKANEARRHKIPRARYRVTNWPEYDRALQQRGSLTVWVTPEALQLGIRPRRAGGAGRAPTRTSPSRPGICCAWPLVVLGGRPRACCARWLACSIWISAFPTTPPSPAQPRPGARHGAGAGPGERPVHVVIDATGLKVYGAGEWLVEKHGGRGGRTWRKLHLAVDPSSGEILASALTTTEEGDAALVGPLLEQITGPIASVIADGAYDGEPIYRAVAERQPDPPVAVIIPPRATAVPSPTADTTPSQRDQHIRTIQDKGRLGWQKAVGYGRRSLGETAMFRYKTIIGRGLRARTLPAQKTEARVACSVLNRMTRLGMPVSQRIA